MAVRLTLCLSLAVAAWGTAHVAAGAPPLVTTTSHSVYVAAADAGEAFASDITADNSGDVDYAGGACAASACCACGDNDCCTPDCCACDGASCNTRCGSGGGWFVEGWLDQGFTWNPDSPNDRFNTPMTFNDRSNEYQMNQLYLSMGRNVRTDGCAWDAGGRVDLLYGTDYFFTTATGLETYDDNSQRWNPAHGPRGGPGGPASLYGLAMPQLYAEFAAPIGYGTTVKIGHFNTILGFESVMAPQNFFYSHSYAMQYGEPFTHTGFLVSHHLTPNLKLHGGMTRGWNTWEDPNKSLGFLGGASWTSRDRRTSLDFALHTGDEDPNGDNNRTAYSLVLTRRMTSRLTYILQHDLGVEADGAFGGEGQPIGAHWYGINQYWLYQMTRTTALGVRAEWFYDPENTRVLAVPFESMVEGGNYTAVSLGLNWSPSERLTIRPEVRWDWSDVSVPGVRAGMFDDFSDKNQFTLGTDVIFVF